MIRNCHLTGRKYFLKSKNEKNVFLRQKPTELIASRTLFKKNKNKTLRDIFKHKKNYPRWKHGNEENVKY